MKDEACRKMKEVGNGINKEEVVVWKITSPVSESVDEINEA